MLSFFLFLTCRPLIVSHKLNKEFCKKCLTTVVIRCSVSINRCKLHICVLNVRLRRANYWKWAIPLCWRGFVEWMAVGLFQLWLCFLYLPFGEVGFTAPRLLTFMVSKLSVLVFFVRKKLQKRPKLFFFFDWDVAGLKKRWGGGGQSAVSLSLLFMPCWIGAVICLNFKTPVSLFYQYCLHYMQKKSDVKISDVNFRALFILFRTNFGHGLPTYHS